MSIEIQEKTVQEVAGIMESDWEKITVNMEIGYVEGTLVRSAMSDFWSNGEEEEFDLTFDAAECFQELQKEMKKNSKDNIAWTVCDLSILSNGNFEFEFSYGKPERLSELMED